MQQQENKVVFHITSRTLLFLPSVGPSLRDILGGEWGAGTLVPLPARNPTL